MDKGAVRGASQGYSHGGRHRQGHDGCGGMDEAVRGTQGWH